MTSSTVPEATGVLPEVRPAAVPEVERRTTSLSPLDDPITLPRGPWRWRLEETAGPVRSSKTDGADVHYIPRAKEEGRPRFWGSFVSSAAL